MYHLLVDSLICARIRIASFQLPGQSPHAQPQGRGGRETKTFKHNTCVGRLTRKVDGVTGIFMCRIVQRTHRVTQCRHCTIMFGVLDLIDYRPGFVAFIRCLCVNGQMGSFPLKIVVALTRRKNKLNREKTKNKFVWRVCRVWESDIAWERVASSLPISLTMRTPSCGAVPRGLTARVVPAGGPLTPSSL